MQIKKSNTYRIAWDFIPDFIEIGVNILNPVRVSAAGTDTAKLKKEFGNDTSFRGRGCDSQHILPYGTPDEVREEVKIRITILRKTGDLLLVLFIISRMK